MCRHGGRTAAPCKDRKLQRRFHHGTGLVGEILHRYAKSRGKQGVVSLPQPHAGVTPVGTHGPKTVHHGIADQKHRRGVVAPVGGKAVQLLHVGQRQLAQRRLGIQLEGSSLHAGGVVGSPLVDGLAEGGQAGFLNFNTGSGGVTAETGQILRTVAQGAVQVKAVGGAPAAAPFPLVHRDDDGGAVVALHQAGGHNADHAGVPVLPCHDQHAVVCAGGVGFQRFQCLGKDCLFGLLALGVDLRQAGGNAHRLLLVAAKQQF